jgi:hypothetical protein
MSLLSFLVSRNQARSLEQLDLNPGYVRCHVEVRCRRRFIYQRLCMMHNNVCNIRQNHATSHTGLVDITSLSRFDMPYSSGIKTVVCDKPPPWPRTVYACSSRTSLPWSSLVSLWPVTRRCPRHSILLACSHYHSEQINIQTSSGQLRSVLIVMLYTQVIMMHN